MIILLSAVGIVCIHIPPACQVLEYIPIFLGNGINMSIFSIVCLIILGLEVSTFHSSAQNVCLQLQFGKVLEKIS